VVDLLQQEAGRFLADLVLGDPHGGEGRAPPLHERHVVVADDGDGVRAGAAGHLGGGVAPQRHQVIPGQNGRGGGGLGQQGHGGVFGFGGPECRTVANADQSRIEPEASC
jgi:hypothetical protein